MRRPCSGTWQGDDRDTIPPERGVYPIPALATAVAVVFVAAMISPTQSAFVASSGLSLADFEPDAPRPATTAGATSVPEGVIDGVTVTALTPHSDERGSLCELLTTRNGPIEPIVHVYQATALPGSIRAWVYHRRQHDRLADPDKCRLPARDPRIPFSFDDR